MIETPCVVASRGRNPIIRCVGHKRVFEQRLEANGDGYSNTLTGVCKDNWLMEERDMSYKIRRLTPLECWRLMGFSDADYNKAAKVSSETQLYKQAGNSIVENVLIAIFSQMHIKNCMAWNDETEGSRQKIVTRLFNRRYQR